MGTTAENAPQWASALRHEVHVPKRYGVLTDKDALFSAAAGYALSYEDAWGECIRRFSLDMSFTPSELDKAGTGWPAELQGYHDGFTDAESRVNVLRRKYGSERTQAVLRQAVSHATAKG